MNRQPVDSSNLKSVGYDDDRHLLEIEFASGAIYDYNGVSNEIYDQLMRASSLGSFFHRSIKDKYPCVRIR